MIHLPFHGKTLNFKGKGNIFIGIIASLLLTSILYSKKVKAQNLDNMDEQEPVRVSGSLSATGIGYATSLADPRRNPFSYFLSGSLNLSLYGWDIPVSLSYSNQDLVVRQPFNQLGLSPNYKWFTAHLGWRSMHFSDYTLAGHSFLGMGVEAEPGIWRVKMMYGRLNKGISFHQMYNDSSAYAQMDPSYERWGYGCKVGVGDPSQYVDLILFRARDQVGSIPGPPDSLGLKPESNLVLGVNAGMKIGERIQFSTEFASSALNRDRRAEEISLASGNLFGYTSGLFTTRASSSFYNAYNTELAYLGDQYQVNLGYERVDPGYETLGAYFFNNDLENFTVGGNTSLLKNKINLYGNFGVQRNNLDDDRINSRKRLISSINCSYAPEEQWHFSGSYSNFLMNSRRAPRLNELVNRVDTLTLEFVQITNNANVTANYSGKANDNTYGLNFNFNYQQSTQEQPGKQPIPSQYYNSNLTYSYQYTNLNLGFATSLNLNQNVSENYNSKAIGPAISLNKSFMDNAMTATFSSAYNFNMQNERQNNIFNTRLNASYKVLENNHLRLSLVMINREARGENVRDFTEFTGTLNYRYSF